MVEPAKSVPVTPSSDAPPEEALQRIESKIDQLNQRVEKVEQQTAPKPEKPKEHASKAAVAATFALAGLKLGAFFLGKIGLLVFDHPRAFRRGGTNGIAELWTTIMTFGKDKSLVETADALKYTLYGSAAGTIGGPIIGAIIGYKRGDRLEKASDLFVHPIESMKKIFGDAPIEPKAEAKPNAPDPSIAQGSPRGHEGILTTAPMREVQ